MLSGKSKRELNSIAFQQMLIEVGLHEQYLEAKDAYRVTTKNVQLRILANRLDSCCIGDGNGLRDITAEIFKQTLDMIVDPEYIRLEAPCAHGYADIELPIALERLDSNALFQTWTHRYDLRSIIAEVKNEKRKCPVKHVDQLFRYLDSSIFGKFGLLVSNSGFTRNAMRNLRDIATRGKKLILPMHNTDLHDLLRAREIGKYSVMQTLRRLETNLRQLA